MSFDSWVFFPLLMNNLASAKSLECLRDSRRVVAAVATEVALAQGLGTCVVFAEDSFPRTVPTVPTPFYQRVQVHGAPTERSLPGVAEPFLNQGEASVTAFPCGRHLWPSGSLLAGSWQGAFCLTVPASGLLSRLALSQGGVHVSLSSVEGPPQGPAAPGAVRSSLTCQLRVCALLPSLFGPHR